MATFHHHHHHGTEVLHRRSRYFLRVLRGTSGLCTTIGMIFSPKTTFLTVRRGSGLPLVANEARDRAGVLHHLCPPLHLVLFLGRVPDAKSATIPPAARRGPVECCIQANAFRCCCVSSIHNLQSLPHSLLCYACAMVGGKGWKKVLHNLSVGGQQPAHPFRRKTKAILLVQLQGHWPLQALLSVSFSFFPIAPHFCRLQVHRCGQGEEWK